MAIADALAADSRTQLPDNWSIANEKLKQARANLKELEKQDDYTSDSSEVQDAKDDIALWKSRKEKLKLELELSTKSTTKAHPPSPLLTSTMHTQARFMSNNNSSGEESEDLTADNDEASKTKQPPIAPCHSPTNDLHQHPVLTVHDDDSSSD